MTPREKKSKFFHSIEKGCKMKPFDMISDSSKGHHNGVHIIHGFECLTHKAKNLCRCGWEFKKHFSN